MPPPSVIKPPFSFPFIQFSPLFLPFALGLSPPPYYCTSSSIKPPRSLPPSREGTARGGADSPFPRLFIISLFLSPFHSSYAFLFVFFHSLSFHPRRRGGGAGYCYSSLTPLTLMQADWLLAVAKTPAANQSRPLLQRHSKSRRHWPNDSGPSLYR